MGMSNTIEGGVTMSVLSDLVHERTEWSNRHNALAVRHNHLKAVTDYTVLLLIGLLLYFYHDRILIFVKRVLNL